MNIETKLRQMLVFTLSASSNRLEPYLAQGLGGILFFRRNLGTLFETKCMLETIQRSAAYPVLKMIDQEGGITNQISEFDVPSNMALTASGDEVAVYESAAYIGRGLRSLGFNMNLAPVIDVQNNPANPVIGIRSFGQDPKVVAGLAKQAIAGYQGQGLIACAKHFPGHGDAAVDTHQAGFVSPHCLERLRELEWLPFKAAINAGVKAIMTAHMAVSAIDGSNPATLSAPILGHLRNELDFHGLIVSDLLSMQAIAKRYEPTEACTKAIRAGVDLLLVHDDIHIQETIWNELATVVRGDKDFRKCVEESYERISWAKSSLAEPVQGEGSINLDLAKVAEKALIEISQGERLVDRVKSADSIAILSFRDNIPLEAPTQVEEEILNMLNYLGKSSDIFREPQNLLQGYDLYLILSSKRGPLSPETVGLLQTIPLRKRVALALSNPYLLHQLNFYAILYTFGHNPVALKALMAYFAESVVPQGVPPVSLRP